MIIRLNKKEKIFCSDKHALVKTKIVSLMQDRVRRNSKEVEALLAPDVFNLGYIRNTLQQLVKESLLTKIRVTNPNVKSKFKDVYVGTGLIVKPAKPTLTTLQRTLIDILSDGSAMTVSQIELSLQLHPTFRFSEIPSAVWIQKTLAGLVAKEHVLARGTLSKSNKHYYYTTDLQVLHDKVNTILKEHTRTNTALSTEQILIELMPTTQYPHELNLIKVMQMQGIKQVGYFLDKPVYITGV